METALRMNNLGMIEQEGIFRIVPYEEAVAANTVTTMIKLETAKGEDVQTLLKELIVSWPEKANISVSVNKGANILVVSAPKTRIEEMTELVKKLDVSKPVLPTVTEAISLNYAEPEDMVKVLQKTLTPSIGQIAGDLRSRHLIVTDMPIVVEQVKQLVESLDKPVKQVMIETMVVDVTLNDNADTGIKWLASAVKRQNARSAALGPTGPKVGTLQNLDLSTSMETLQSAAGLLNFGLLTKNIDWSGLIEAEVRNQNGRLLSNPVVMTVENKEAAISISQEIPYTDLSQTSNGGSQTSTRFKDVGTVFTLTPQVTNDEHIICKVSGKESFENGTFNGVPIEDKRQIESTMRMSTGQTIFIGGLRHASGTSTTRKMPILGDIPVVNFLFRVNGQAQKVQDLLVFVTCNVIKEDVPLTDRQKEIIGDVQPGQSIDAWTDSVKDFVHPHYNNSLHYKFRRGE
jgi:type IV pilus assembly protein PilQ